VAGAEPLFVETSTGPFTPGSRLTVMTFPDAEQSTSQLEMPTIDARREAISAASVAPASWMPPPPLFTSR
jgi:hypothetical protein